MIFHPYFCCYAEIGRGIIDSSIIKIINVRKEVRGKEDKETELHESKCH